jgi:hypothetical protein
MTRPPRVMLFAVRCYAVLASLLLLPACASLPGSASTCEPSSPVATVIELGEHRAFGDEGCQSSVLASRFQAVGGVRQRGSQTRTVGVPRSFLIAMLVLLLVFGLA